MRRRSLAAAIALLGGLTCVGTAATPAAASHSHCTREAATIVGTPGDDVLFGTDEQDIILGLGGNDRIEAGGSDTEYQYDRICGGAGDDVLVGRQDREADPYTESEAIVVGGPGNDRLLGGVELKGGRGRDELRGGEGRDRLWGGPGNDVIDGGTPDDGPSWTVDAAIFEEGPVNANLVTHEARGEGHDRLIGIEQLIGTPQDDVFRGDEDGNFLDGRGGSDELFGGGGEDVLVPDGLAGRKGPHVFESVRGGPGRDAIALDGYDQGAVVNLRRGTMRVGESSRGRVAGVEDVIGSGEADTLIGNEEDNYLAGGRGSDVLRGGAGTDTLEGGPGTDTCTQGETETGCD
jgi:Ca2+-binding RTX toxin-like protein